MIRFVDADQEPKRIVRRAVAHPSEPSAPLVADQPAATPVKQRKARAKS